MERCLYTYKGWMGLGLMGLSMGLGLTTYIEMDPHMSLGRLCMDENHKITLNDMIENEGNWSGLENFDTGDSGKKKEIKAFIFNRMESEEVCERYITPCFVKGLDAYNGVTDLKYEKNLISNEFVVKLGLAFEVMKNGEKVVNQKLRVALKGVL
ncbi:hypothetical protein Tco_0796722 [Tanacetum coccineum]